MPSPTTRSVGCSSLRFSWCSPVGRWCSTPCAPMPCKPRGVFALASRETALIANNVLLAVAGFVVFIGTVWPLVAELAWDQKLSVGPPFFDAAFTPFMVALALILPVGALIPWKRARLGRAGRSLLPALIAAIAIGALVWTMQSGRSILAPVAAALAVWTIGGTLVELWIRAGQRSGRDEASPARRFATRRLGQSRGAFGLCDYAVWGCRADSLADRGYSGGSGRRQFRGRSLSGHSGRGARGCARPRTGRRPRRM